MAVYFAIFNRQRRASHGLETTTGTGAKENKFESVKLLPAKLEAAPFSKGGLEDAQVILLEAASVAEAQMGVRHFFPNCGDTPVIVTEAQFKES